MRVGIGIREHSGWGVLVAAGLHKEEIRILLRRRVSLFAEGLPREAFHAASGMPRDEAFPFVLAAAESARLCARGELAAAHDELRRAGHEIAGIGAGIGLGPVRAPFEKVMASHALLHASEGDMYRDAVAEAAEGLGLAVSRAPWREIWAQLGAETGLGPDAVRDRVARVRETVGAPWTSDEKEACAAAWLALVRHG